MTSRDLWFVEAVLHLPDDLQARLAPQTRVVQMAHRARLLLDTGSRQSGLAESMFESMQCPDLGVWRITTTAGESRASYSRILVRFAHDLICPMENLRVARLRLPPKLQGFDGVLGRDVLSKWELLYGGPNGTLTIRDHLSFVGWLAS